MADPKHQADHNSPSILVEVTRGDTVESMHFGVVAVADTEGNIRHWTGDPTTRTYYRSASKPLQAIPIVESGAAESWRAGEIAKLPPLIDDPFSSPGPAAGPVFHVPSIGQASALQPSPSANTSSYTRDWPTAPDRAQIDLADKLIALIASQQAADEFFATANTTEKEFDTAERQADR